jgi:hypothetical protein
MVHQQNDRLRADANCAPVARGGNLLGARYGNPAVIPEGVELVLGGFRRVAIKGKPQLDGNRVALRLKCVAAEKCKSVVKLKRNGKVLGRAKVTIKRNKTRSVRVALNKRGRKVLHDGSRVKVEVLSKDKKGNGWRSSKTVRLR